MIRNSALCQIKVQFILTRIQEEKLYMCFVDVEKAFDRVPKKVVE